MFEVGGVVWLGDGLVWFEVGCDGGWWLCAGKGGGDQEVFQIGFSCMLK